MSVAVARGRTRCAMLCGGGRDDAHDRGARPVALAAGGGLGAEVPRRGERRSRGDRRRWFLDLLRRSRLLRWSAPAAGAAASRRRHARAPPRTACRARPRLASAGRPSLASSRCSSLALSACCVATIGSGCSGGVSRWRSWRSRTGRRCAGLTLGRVLAVDGAGHAVGACRPGSRSGCRRGCRASLQPVVQVVASFPAPMLFPLVDRAAARSRASALGWGSILLMLLGHAVVHPVQRDRRGDAPIPADLREAARSYRLGALAALPDALPAGRLPVPGDRLGDGGGRRLERQHRRRVRDLHGRDARDASGLGAAISQAAGSRPTSPLLAAAVAGDVRWSWCCSTGSSGGAATASPRRASRSNK